MTQHLNKLAIITNKFNLLVIHSFLLVELPYHDISMSYHVKNLLMLCPIVYHVTQQVDSPIIFRIIASEKQFGRPLFPATANSFATSKYPCVEKELTLLIKH
ncbi:hypothetical protein CEXT_389041 [Caerostris extrusa]|uniref:Uncharacterized protein n=1 Tax=Caerostris extrusa TaxID=172846 RepID=A0AAV4NWP2_CAEEX|nr:hypothetical protein CEXT_389041 [Caerostris extrusa]